MQKSITTPQVLHLVARLAACLFLYFVYSKQSSLWLFYLPLLIILLVSLALGFYEWKKGNQKLVLYYLLSFALLMLTVYFL